MKRCTLSEMVATGQAIAIIPNVLYFASVAERPPPTQGWAASTEQVSSRRSAVRQRGATEEREASQRSSHVAFDDGPPRTSESTRRPSETLDGVSDTTREVLGHELARDLLHDNGHGGGAVMREDGFYFSIAGDPAFDYHNFFADFGPLDLGCLVRFSRRLERVLQRSAHYAWVGGETSDAPMTFGPPPMDPFATSTNTRESLGDMPPTVNKILAAGSLRQTPTTSAPTVPVVFCTGLHAHERANAACLLGCFCVATLRWRAITVQQVFQRVYPPFLPFRDASIGASSYPLGVMDVVHGLERAVQHGWLSIHHFDLAAFEQAKSLDYSWVVPGKLMAFSSPDDSHPERSAVVYASALHRAGVTMVVRLNDPLYRPGPFLRHSIQHVEMLFPDGTAPNDAVLKKYLRLVESELGESVRNTSGSTQPIFSRTGGKVGGVYRGLPPAKTLDAQRRQRRGAPKGVVATHCRAGLGRTGTVLAVYIMRHYGFSAREAMGWMRLCRPGSITGVQQQYLEEIERRLAPPAHIVDRQIATTVLESGAAAGGRIEGSRFTYQSHGAILRDTSARDEEVPLVGANSSTMGMSVSRLLGSRGTAVPSPPLTDDGRGGSHSRPITSDSGTNAVEQRFELAEVEALLRDPQYIPHRSLLDTLKYPSSYFLVVEHVGPLRAAVALQSQFAIRRTQKVLHNADNDNQCRPLSSMAFGNRGKGAGASITTQPCSAGRASEGGSTRSRSSSSGSEEISCSSSCSSMDSLPHERVIFTNREARSRGRGERGGGGRAVVPPPPLVSVVVPSQPTTTPKMRSAGTTALTSRGGLTQRYQAAKQRDSVGNALLCPLIQRGAAAGSPKYGIAAANTTTNTNSTEAMLFATTSSDRGAMMRRPKTQSGGILMRSAMKPHQPGSPTAAGLGSSAKSLSATDGGGTSTTLKGIMHRGGGGGGGGSKLLDTTCGASSTMSAGSRDAIHAVLDTSWVNPGWGTALIPLGLLAEEQQ